MNTSKGWRKSSYSGDSGGNCIEVRDWHKSSYRGDSGAECVEVGHDGPHTIPVRDSKNPTGPVLTFSPDAWRAFVGSVKSGEFAGRSLPVGDHPAG